MIAEFQFSINRGTIERELKGEPLFSKGRLYSEGFGHLDFPYLRLNPSKFSYLHNYCFFYGNVLSILYFYPLNISIIFRFTSKITKQYINYFYVSILVSLYFDNTYSDIDCFICSVQWFHVFAKNLHNTQLYIYVLVFLLIAYMQMYYYKHEYILTIPICLKNMTLSCPWMGRDYV